jgi:hypothetical protein
MQTHQQPAAVSAAVSAAAAAVCLAGSTQVLALFKKGERGPLAILHTQTGEGNILRRTLISLQIVTGGHTFCQGLT